MIISKIRLTLSRFLLAGGGRRLVWNFGGSEQSTEFEGKTLSPSMMKRTEAMKVRI